MEVGRLVFLAVAGFHPRSEYPERRMDDEFPNDGGRRRLKETSSALAEAGRRALVTLDQIASDPGCATGLPRATVIALLRRMAVAQAALVLELDPVQPSNPAVADDQWLTPAEAAVVLRKRARWLYRNAHRLPFVKRVSNRSLLCSKAGLQSWLAARKV
jgi:hypothetical protein